MYQVRAAERVVKEIESLSVDVRRHLRLALLDLSRDPFPAGCKKLSGNLAGFFRIRVGAYRAIYKVDSLPSPQKRAGTPLGMALRSDPSKIVIIVKVGPRKDIYR